MAVVELVTTATPDWRHFVEQHPRATLLQTAEWGQLKAGFGWDWDLVTLKDEGALVAGAVVLYRALPLHLGTLAYVPRGPVVDWTDPALVEQLFDALHHAARRRRAWACWIEPEVREEAAPVGTLTGLGYRPSPRTVQPRSTLVVDLSSPEDDILMAMKSKTRYNIRLAERKGVSVRQGSVADVGRFHALMEMTGERDAFGVHTEAYYRRALELFAPHEQAALFLAEYEGQPLAGLLAFAVGHTAWYLAGASSNEHRNLMAPYAVQWAAMRWARARGCTSYDLWGIPDAPEAQLEAEFADRSDGLWGVYRFKRGFGGELVRYTGLWERALTPLYPLATKLYRGFS